jgi:hypothetical protein
MHVILFYFCEHLMFSVVSMSGRIHVRIHEWVFRVHALVCVLVLVLVLVHINLYV